ncbi:MAG: cysteine peptidase family C39 domain-containing protein [Bacteroidota bacterium]|jgi:ABC-type bacteriocin/lantibiotic exporter with double-glycine peptidase domain
MNYRIQTAVDDLFTAVKSIEELFHLEATMLPNFPRCVQLDLYSCGAKSVYAILKYFKKRCNLGSVEEALRTDYYGTTVDDIKRVLRENKVAFKELKKATLKDIRRAIDENHPVLVSVGEDSHYCVVYGYSDTHVFVMDPLITSLKCAIAIKEWRERWDRWGLVTSKK